MDATFAYSRKSALSTASDTSAQYSRTRAARLRQAPMSFAVLGFRGSAERTLDLTGTSFYSTRYC